MEEYNIRRATASDLEAVDSLLYQVLEVHHKGRPDLFCAGRKKYSDDELLIIFENPDTPVFVCERRGRVVGYAFCALERVTAGNLKPMTTLYIDDICVDAAERGGHIGSRLFSHVREFARSEGCYNITLHVWECNPGARSFYEAMGMKPQYTSMELICDDGGQK